MQRKDWFFVVFILLLMIGIDQASKLWASGITEMSFGIFRFILIHNHGAMLGLFSDLPAVLRIVTLSTSGIFILCIYSLIQYLISKKLMGLRIGLSILVGGILGNVLDRILHGYVIDFMAIQLGTWHSPVWNLADAVQWVGYVLMCYSIFKNNESLWPDQNERKSFWVNKKFQIKYATFITVVGFFLTLISLVFSYTYLKVTITELAGDNPATISRFTTPFLLTFIVLSLIFSLILFSVGKVISHQIAGPVYAFERFLKEVLAGKGLESSGVALKLRDNDDFKHLEILAEQVRTKLIQLNKEHDFKKSDQS